MPLPKVTKELMDTTALSLTGNPIKYLIDGLEDLNRENPDLGQFLYSASIHDAMDDLQKEAFVRGAVAVYILLRNQAQADELKEQWGD